MAGGCQWEDAGVPCWAVAEYVVSGPNFPNRIACGDQDHLLQTIEQALHAAREVGQYGVRVERYERQPTAIA